MKYLLMILIIIIGSCINQYVPANWQYTWGYIVGIMLSFIIFYLE